MATDRFSCPSVTEFGINNPYRLNGNSSINAYYNMKIHTLLRQFGRNVLFQIESQALDIFLIHIPVFAVGYSAVHYCLWLTRGLAPFVTESYIAFHYCLRFVRGLVPFVADGYIAFHYCLRFTTGRVPFITMAIMLSITV